MDIKYIVSKKGLIMAYNELIKNFSKIRDYMREFYVYGFRSRDEFDKKSARTYDDEKRRIESFLGDYMQFRQDKDGKKVFISIDSRKTAHNPLYKVWKTKSFTDGDITLHFLIFDILSNEDTAYTISEITKRIDTMLLGFDEPKLFDESTVRKKLNEYRKQGLIVTYKQGKNLYYKRSNATANYSANCLTFFSEIYPCGVIGSYLLDKVEEEKDCIRFKHHYLTSSIDSEILTEIFLAINERKTINLEIQQKNGSKLILEKVVPLKVFISVQNGREYVAIYKSRISRIAFCRIDNILSITKGDVCLEFDKYNELLEDMRKHMWGVDNKNLSTGRTEHVEFVLKYNENENYIHERLIRESRCGTVTRIDNNTSRFVADVYNVGEMVPWIRTFIGRISEIHFSDKNIEKQFLKDIEDMYNLYELEKEVENDI